MDLVADVAGKRAGLERRDDPRQNPRVAVEQPVQIGGKAGGRVEVGARQHVVDHALKAEPAAIFGRIDARDAVGVELVHLLGDDHAATAAENADVPAAVGAQQVEHVLEVLHVPALIRADGDPLDILLQRRPDDFVDGAVMAEVHDLGAAALKQPTDDVNRCIVAIEQAGGGHEPDRVARLVGPALD